MKTIKNVLGTKLILACFLSICVIVGCKKDSWYDVKADKSLAVPITLKDMQALLDNTQALNTFTPGMGEIASDGYYLDNAAAMTLTGVTRNAYTWSHEQQNLRVSDWNNGSATSSGSGSYVRIYYANLVLDGLPKINPNGEIEQIQWNNIKGQSLFHRAHAFYELAQIFAPPYDANASSKLGIPLRLESDINIASKRSTLQQTYDQIINDLTQAKDLLPESPLYKTRPSKQAIYALLARAYLSMENYEQAGTYARLCLNSYSALMDYKTLDTTTIDNPIIGYNPEIIFYTYMAPHTPIFYPASNILIDKNLYNDYNNNDLRKKIFFKYDNLTGLVTYKGNYSSNGYENCFSGLATDEVYLISAECYARAGKVTEAMADLNTLLRTRWQPKLTPTEIEKPYIDISATNEEDALRKVLKERKKELILRGTRWSDLRRLNRDPRFEIKLTRTIGGKTYTLEPNSYKYTFPIPDDIIKMTGMEQNEGWK